MTQCNQRYFEEWYSDRTWKSYTPLLGEVVATSAPGPILDVGAGMGFFVEAAHRWGLACTGIEQSEWAVAAARERDPNLHLLVHDVCRPLPFADGEFATVLMNQVIEHLDSTVARSILTECFRVLKPEGWLIVRSPSSYNREEREADPTHINLLSPSELRALLAAAGFAKVIAQDQPLAPFRRALLNRLVSRSFRAFRWERLSATANAIAQKPSS